MGNAWAGSGAFAVAGMVVGLIIEFGCGRSVDTLTAVPDRGVDGRLVGGSLLKSISAAGDGPNRRTPGLTKIQADYFVILRTKEL